MAENVKIGSNVTIGRGVFVNGKPVLPSKPAPKPETSQIPDNVAEESEKAVAID